MSASPALRVGDKKGEALVDMKIIQHIRVRKENMSLLESLECVEHIEHGQGPGITVFLDPSYTKGQRAVRNDEYLIQFESGLWQRCGAEAFNNIFLNPSREAGKQWQQE